MTDALVARIAEALCARGQRLACAESCTGGLIAAACTERAGASAWFDRGFVTYSNEAKTAMLDVPPALLATHGAVSEPVACAMAAGALARSDAHWAIAVTGIAGPDGGSAAKPIGTVWLALGWRSADGSTLTQAQCRCFSGERQAIRQAAVVWVLERLAAKLAAGA